MDSNPELVELPPCVCVAIRARVPLAALPAFFSGAFAELGAAAGPQIAGPPFALYHAFEGSEVELTAAFPVRASVPVSGRVTLLSLPGGPAVRVEHHGSYDDMRATYGTIDRWITEHARARAGAPREIYLTPPTPQGADQVTQVVQPLA